MEIQGIDVSYAQGAINWPKVKAAGKEFAFIRLGWAGWDGPISVDKCFTANMEGALAAGLKVGIYVYSYCKTPAAAVVAAREALELVKPYKLEYPIVFDIEDTSDAGTRYDNMTRAENTTICKAFLQAIEAAGYYSLLYTYKYFADGYINMADLAAHDVWIAQYNTTCTYSGKYGIWQYTGSGRCDGIVGDVDLNIAYKDYAAIIKANGLNTGPNAAPAPPESDTVPKAQYDALLATHTQLQAHCDALQQKHSALLGDIDALIKKYGG